MLIALSSHHLSEKHLDLRPGIHGVDNIRDLDNIDQIAALVCGMIGKRLRCKELTA